MASNGKHSPGKRRLLAILIASGRTVRDAAPRAGVGESTAYHWYAQPEFRAEIDELRQQCADAALGKVTALLTAASDRLAVLVNDPNSSVSMGAVRTVFDVRSKLRADAGLAQKVEELEKIVQELLEREKLGQHRGQVSNGSAGPVGSAPECGENE